MVGYNISNQMDTDGGTGHKETRRYSNITSQ